MAKKRSSGPGKKIDVMEIKGREVNKIDLRFSQNEMKFYGEYRDVLYEARSPRELRDILAKKIEETDLLESDLKRYIHYNLSFHYRSSIGINAYSGTSRNAGEPPSRWNSVMYGENLAGIIFLVNVVDVSEPLPGKPGSRLSVMVPQNLETGELTEPTEKPTPDHYDMYKDQLIPFTPERWNTIVALRSQLRKLYERLEEVFVDRAVLTAALDKGVGALMLPAPTAKKPKAG